MMLDVKMLSRELSIGRDRAYCLMRNNGFPSIKIGNTYRVSEEALERWKRQYEGREFVLK